jgi:hypothetical protein
VVKEEDDPYIAADTTCKSSVTPYFYIAGYYQIPGDVTRDLIKQAIMDYGGLYSSMYYDDEYYNSVTKTYCCTDTSNSTNHGVLIVGWDDNKVTDCGVGAWIVKNSWGTSWGENGYFYISYSDYYFAKTAATYNTRLSYGSAYTIYGYDDFGGTSSTGYADTLGYGLVKFVPSSLQEINRVGTWVKGHTRVTIEVYDTMIGGTLSNMLASVANQDCPNTGYFSFAITPFTQPEGDDFYVKVKYESWDGLSYIIPREVKITGYCNPTIETGKYWLSHYGSSWTAIGGGTLYNYDLCIRAYGGCNVVADAGSDKTIYKGSTTRLLASGGTTYSWNTGDTSSTISVIPSGTRDYYLTVRRGTCSGKDTVRVTVLAQGGVDTICSGDTITLYPSDTLYSMKFDGVNDRLGLSNSSDLSITGNMTIEMWIKISSYSENIQTIYNKAFGGESSVYIRNGKVGFSYGRSGNDMMPYQALAMPSVLPLNQWRHVAFVRDTVNKKIRMYLNGNLIKEADMTYDNGVRTTREVLIGRGQNGNYFNGYLDDIKVWNKVLSQVEIQNDMYARYDAPYPSNLKLYINFNQGYGKNVDVMGVNYAERGPDVVVEDMPIYVSDYYRNRSYLWSTGATTADIRVWPVSNTTYRVTITESGSSVHTRSVIVKDCYAKRFNMIETELLSNDLNDNSNLIEDNYAKGSCRNNLITKIYPNPVSEGGEIILEYGESDIPNEELRYIIC